MCTSAPKGVGPRLSTPASFPASSRNDANPAIPANTYLFRQDGLSANTAKIYLEAVREACRSSGQNLALQSAVTRLVYHKKQGMPFHEYLTAHVAYIVDGVIRPDFSAEVDFHRYIDKVNHSKPHIVALLRSTPLVGVDLHAPKHRVLDTSRPLRDIVRLPFLSSSACSTYDADDTIVIRPINGRPFHPEADKAQAVLEFRDPGQFPFSLERLASLVDFATRDVAPAYNPVGQNCYHMSSWVWNAVIGLAKPHVNVPTSDLKAMGKFGKVRLVHGKSVAGPFLLSEAKVTELHLEEARKRWHDYEKKCRVASMEKLETMHRMESEKRIMEARVAAAEEKAQLAKERSEQLERDVQVLRSQRHTTSQQSRRQSVHGA